MSLRKQVEETVSYLETKGIDKAEVGIILGTGLGGLIDVIEVEKTIDYSSIPNFAISTIEFHHGKLVYGDIEGHKVLAMQGRFHYYEGYSMKEITFPLYVMKSFGIKYLLISNAAGNLNMDWEKGNLMLIDDHINLLPENPLRGENDEHFGPRFPDMSAPYSEKLNAEMMSVASEEDILLRTGVYTSVEGPNLETRAEYRYLRTIGSDAVGMSTVPEVIVANYLSIPVCAISVLTDDCDPDNLKPANINDIISIAKKSEQKLTVLFKQFIKRIN